MKTIAIEKFHELLREAFVRIDSLYLYGIGKVSLSNDEGMGFHEDFITGKPKYHFASLVSLVDKDVENICIDVDLISGKASVRYLDGTPHDYDIWEYEKQPVTVNVVKEEDTGFGTAYHVSLVIGDESNPFERRKQKA
ncbi:MULTISPECIES: hypothetical protein [Brevibacillus]|uniref:hypothetical protein n=1 Tax=Brevibacillus TaxID=55080 RepID=UPI0004F24BF4|nr:hypothetical protein [Brevibacillus borstelensis]KKX53287.1 hypothetical protein X546_20650 [Brevibacillus borstelensis cifa_chp40]